MKWILRIFGLLLLLVIAGAIYVYMNLGALVKQGIETYAPPILEVPVNVDSVALMPLTGKGSISGFTIASPKGYGDNTAIGLGDFQLALDTASLTTDTIIIEKILIDTPELNFIQNDSGGSNFQTLLDSINSNTADSSSSSTAPAGEESSTDIKLIIDDFSLKNVVISAVSPLLPDQEIQVPIPDIHLTGLGRKAGGAAPADIAKEVAEKLLAEAKKALLNSDIYKEQVKAAVEKRLEEEKAKLKQRVNDEKQQLEDDARRKLDEKLGDKKDLLKGLFK